jgi:hypothetical protein
LTDVAASPLRFPFPTIPELGQMIEVAPGIQWLRLVLPFRLDHVNIYLVEDGLGYAVIDTGIGDEATQAVWTALLDGPLRSRRPASSSRTVIRTMSAWRAGCANGSAFRC